MTLSFRAEEILLAALDEERPHVARDQRRDKVSRTDAVKALLWEAIDGRRKKRGK